MTNATERASTTPAATVDWDHWTPKERATLLFIVKDEKILLIRKKRGLGAGRINAPGGRIEPGESVLAAALRETHEELGIQALHPALRGELRFQFLDGYSLHCSVFLASDLVGEPIETDEAIPLWTPLHAIPYHEMWADDARWLPGMLAGRSFRGEFIFDSDKMLAENIRWETL